MSSTSNRKFLDWCNASFLGLLIAFALFNSLNALKLQPQALRIDPIAISLYSVKPVKQSVQVQKSQPAPPKPTPSKPKPVPQKPKPEVKKPVAKPKPVKPVATKPTPVVEAIEPKPVEAQDIASTPVQSVPTLAVPATSNAQATPAPKPVPIFKLTKFAYIKQQTKTEYPTEMFSLQQEGKVDLKILVDKTGKVRKVEILKASNDVFATAAKEAAMNWIFSPAEVNGNPVACYFKKSIIYKLE